MSEKKRYLLDKKEALYLGLKLNKIQPNKKKARYLITEDQYNEAKLHVFSNRKRELKEVIVKTGT